MADERQFANVTGNAEVDAKALSDNRLSATKMLPPQEDNTQ